MPTGVALPATVNKKKGRWKIVKKKKKRSTTETEIDVPEEEERAEQLEVDGEHHGCRGAWAIRKS